MYRFLREALPEDPDFPHDLKGLGYFINDTDHIKSIEDPNDDFQFWLTTNERYNDVQREAMHNCIRREVSARLTTLNLPLLYLPTLSTTPPPKSTPHLPIHSTPLPLLPTKSHILLIMNKPFEDLAIWAYRTLSKQGGINAGSAVSLVQEIRRRASIRARKLAVTAGRNIKDSPPTPDEIEAQTPGIIILNPGQLLYSYAQGRAMTPMSWDARPRKSAVHPAPRIHAVHNFVPGNRSADEHTDFVFRHIIGDPAIVSPSAELYMISIADGADGLLEYLADHVEPSLSEPSKPDKGQQAARASEKSALRDRIAAIALTAPRPINHVIGSPVPLSSSNRGILQLLGSRARAWCTSDFPVDTPLENATPDLLAKLEAAAAQEDERARDAIMGELDETAVAEAGLFLCPWVSGGRQKYDECVLPAVYERVLDWFEVVEEKGGAGKYENGILDISEEVVRAKRERRVLPEVGGWGAEEDEVGSSPSSGLVDVD